MNLHFKPKSILNKMKTMFSLTMSKNERITSTLQSNKMARKFSSFVFWVVFLLLATCVDFLCLPLPSGQNESNQ